MGKPTILVDGHVLDGKPQGSAAYIAGLYRAVADTGAAHIRLACGYHESLLRWELKHPNIEWIPLKSRNKYQRLVVEMAMLQTKLNPDFSHFTYITPLLKRSKWINSLHDLLFIDYPQHFSWKYRLKNHTLFRISALRSDLVLTISEYSKQAIHSHFDIPRERIYVTCCAPDRFIDAEAVPIVGLTPGRFIVFVSRFEPRKNQHMLVQAFRSLRGVIDDDIKLVLVGYTALKYAELDETLAEVKRNVDDSVVVLSNIDHTQLTWLYRNAAGAFYPSHAEGFGMPIIEAIAAGGWSYCANNTALTELTPFVHGTFDSNDIESIKKALVQALKDQAGGSRKSLRSEMLKIFNWPNSAATFLKAINV